MDFFSRPGSIKTVHLIAVCGTGMASLACLLKEQGFHVTGSDTNIYPPMSEILAKAGIEVKPGWNRENIAPDTDLVIIGNAISRDNAEAQEAMKRRLPYASFPSALARGTKISCRRRNPWKNHDLVFAELGACRMRPRTWLYDRRMVEKF
jgi:UDP-N-acetylmuramate-alanine ligase